MVIGGLAAGLAAGVGGAASNAMGNWDSVGMWANYMANSGCNLASQAFDRKFRRIDYTIQQQQLHREDIRDLVELTVGRMDVYLIVGTLLLTFCIGWYTDNSILASGLPTWFVTLFLVSNFTAAAYLVFAVWLAMHASVASHSVGVRLLTSFARLSIPSAEEVESIQTNVLPSMEGLLNLGKEMIGMNHKFQDQYTLAGPHNLAAAAASADDHEPPAEDGEDRQAPIKGMIPEDHFKRFLMEQRRWLGYDAYARICMCFGMNQMLQSLSYYILGIVWQVSPISALTSFVAVKMLGSLLLQLDVTGLDGSGKQKDQAALFFLYLVPPIIASIILWLPAVEEYTDNTDTLGVAAFPVFLLHAGWLIYLSAELYRGTPHRPGRHAKESVDFLPKRLRTVAYLNVLQPEQADLAMSQNLEEANRQIAKLDAAREELGQLMEEAMLEESAKKSLSKRSRGKKKLHRAHNKLAKRIIEAREAFTLVRPSEIDEEAHEDVRRAERMLDRFIVWDQAPEICAVLKAFKDQEVQGWLTEEQRRTVENATQEFLTKCHNLGLGVEGAAHEDTSLPQVDAERDVVHIRSYHDLTSMPSSVWISTQSSRDAPNGEMERQTTSGSTASGASTLQWQPVAPRPRPRVPRSAAVNPVSFHSAFEVDLPEWNRSAMNATAPNQDGDPERIVTEQSTAQTVSEATSRFLARRSYIPDTATPDDKLPGVLVQKLTLGTAALWVVCAFVHASRGLLETSGAFAPEPPQHTSMLFRSTSNMRPLAATWPTPAHFFNLGSLQCHGHSSGQADGFGQSVFVSSEYSTYAAQRFSSGDLSEFSEVDDVTSGASAVFCNTATCSALVPESSEGLWELQTIGSMARPAVVHVPGEWRHVVAAAWVRPADSNVRQARLAAWDGHRVVVADMVAEDSREEAWSVIPRFRVSPAGHRRGFDRSIGSSTQGKGVAANVTKYDDVRALQFGARAETLLVLSGSGEVHAWDLVSGDFAARWQVDSGKPGTFTSMCYNGQDFIFAQRRKQGPQLYTAEPPLELQSVLLQQPAEEKMASTPQRPAAEATVEAEVWMKSTEHADEFGARLVLPV